MTKLVARDEQPPGPVHSRTVTGSVAFDELVANPVSRARRTLHMNAQPLVRANTVHSSGSKMNPWMNRPSSTVSMYPPTGPATEPSPIRPTIATRKQKSPTGISQRIHWITASIAWKSPLTTSLARAVRSPPAASPRPSTIEKTITPTVLPAAASPSGDLGRSCCTICCHAPPMPSDCPWLSRSMRAPSLWNAVCPISRIRALSSGGSPAPGRIVSTSTVPSVAAHSMQPR